MAVVSSLGTGSGLDLEGIISKLMSVEAQPLTTLNSKETGYQSKLSAFGSLKSALSTLQGTTQTLAAATTYTAASATISDSTILNASATNNATAGSYTIGVGQLAQAQVLRSNTAFAATTDTFNTGSIAISVGGATATNITIDSSNNSLAGIRDAINAANAGVSATVVNDGTTNRLLLSSNTTGLTAGAIAVSVTDSGAGGSNALSTLDGASLVTVQPPLNASFSVNGLAITRASNTVSDAISGVTMTLTKAGTLASPVTTQINVARNTATIQAAVTAFVSAYNTAATQIKSYTAFNSTTNSASLLTGDSTLRSIQSQLANLVGSNITGLSGGIGRLSDLGISLQKDGTLSTNLSKLQAAIADTGKDIAGFFSATTSGNQGFAVRFNTALDGIVGNTGMIVSRTNGIAQSIKDIGVQRDALNLKLTKIESNYRAQFTALDTAVNSMQHTSSYLTQQLSILQSLVTGVSSSSSSK